MKQNFVNMVTEQRFELHELKFKRASYWHYNKKFIKLL